MQWTKPDFQDITLGMEVTAYVNTDDSQHRSEGEERPTPPTANAEPRSESA